MSGPFLQVSHTAVMNMCRAHKHVSELYPSREVTLCLDPYSGLGLLLWLLTGWGGIMWPLCSSHMTIMWQSYDDDDGIYTIMYYVYVP